MTATNDDPGLKAVELLYQQLQIDDRWSVRRDRGFTWWSYRLAQHVEASEPFKAIDGQERCDVRIWTDVANAVPAHEDPGAPDAMTKANELQTMSALIWNDNDHTVSEHCSSLVHRETVESWSKILSTAAIFQNTHAHSIARTLAKDIGAHVAESRHPESGERPDVDDILHVPDAPMQGAEPSRFAGPLMERLSAPGSILESLSSMTNGDANGLTAEFPYSGEAPAAVAVVTNHPLETALLQIMTDVPHPQFGSGALIILKLPMKVPERDASGSANVLNFLEGTTRTETCLLGAWCIAPNTTDTLAFVSFIPSFLARGGVLENFCIYNAVRTRWAYSVMT
jgi:hypothetical protein